MKATYDNSTMNAILYIIGILLVLVIIELLILIIEVVKLSASLQSHIHISGNRQSQNNLDQNTLISLLSRFGPVRTEQPTTTGDETQTASGEKGKTEGNPSENKVPEEKLQSTAETVSAPDNEPEPLAKESTTTEPEPSTEQTFDTEAAPSNSYPEDSDERYAQSPAPEQQPVRKRSPETETSASSFSVHKCPECGRENSSFRKTCFFCDASLTD